MVCAYQRVPLLGVPDVGRRHPFDRHGRLSLANPSCRLEPAHRLPETGVDQPVAGGHRRAIEQEGGVLDDRWDPIVTADHDLELASGLATQQLGDGDDVRIRAELPPDTGLGMRGQFQNSSEWVTRDQKLDGLAARPDRSEGEEPPDPDCGAPALPAAVAEEPELPVDDRWDRLGSGDMSGALAGATSGCVPGSPTVAAPPEEVAGPRLGGSTS
jgi:hypothetical protein